MYDLIVIGAGPAGLGAAEVAGADGRVAVVDMNVRPGGQYWRHSAADASRGRGRIGRRQRMLSSVDYYPSHRVWNIERGDRFRVHTLSGQRDPESVVLEGRAVLLATGAYDRTLPFPGWDLPGVMTAGGVQSLWKGDGVIPDGRIVLAGTGPFLLPVATGIAAGGGDVVGVWEANRLGRDAVVLAGNLAKAGEAVGYAARMARRRVPYRTGATVVAAHGHDRLESVTVAQVTANWRVVPGTRRRIGCDVLAVGYGFMPQLELAESLGCRLVPGVDGWPVVAVSATQRTSVPGVYAAGESTGVGGAVLAEYEGRLAGHAVVGSRPSARLLAARGNAQRFAERLARAFPVRDGWRAWATDDTVVCRCEEVDHAALARAVAAGGVDPRTAKLLSRAGMGWCQGRVCGFAVTCLTNDDRSALPVSRSIGQPVGLGILAGEGEKGG